MGFRVTKTLVRNYQYISRFDDSVDRDVPDFEERWERYLQGKDLEAPLRPGSSPTIFHFRHLSEKERAKVLSIAATAPALAGIVALGMALYKVENLQDEKGRMVQVKFQMEDGFQVVSNRTIEKIVEAGGRDLIDDLTNRVATTLYPDPL